MLSDVPRDDEDTGTRIHANIAHEDNDVVYGSVPVRNVGAGPAVLVECRLAASAQAMEAQQWARGHASQNVLAPGERVRINFQAAPGSAAYGTLFDQVVGCEQMVMEIRYHDLVEDHEGVLKTELRWDRSRESWRVARSEVRFRVGSSLRLSPQ